MEKTSENDRINETIDAVMRIARGDYSVHIETSDKNDELDSLAVGINMMIEDIKDNVKELEEARETLYERVEELEKFKKVTIDRELKMIEMKKEVDSTLIKYGEKPKYYKKIE